MAQTHQRKKIVSAPPGGAVCEVHCTFSIHSAYLLKSQSENKKSSWSVWIWINTYTWNSWWRRRHEWNSAQSGHTQCWWCQHIIACWGRSAWLENKIKQQNKNKRKKSAKYVRSIRLRSILRWVTNNPPQLNAKQMTTKSSKILNVIKNISKSNKCTAVPNVLKFKKCI